MKKRTKKQEKSLIDGHIEKQRDIFSEMVESVGDTQVSTVYINFRFGDALAIPDDGGWLTVFAVWCDIKAIKRDDPWLRLMGGPSREAGSCTLCFPVADGNHENIVINLIHQIVREAFPLVNIIG